MPRVINFDIIYFDVHVLNTFHCFCTMSTCIKHHIIVTARVGAFGETEIVSREDDPSFHSLPDCPAKMEGGGSLEEVCGRDESSLP